MSDAYGIGCEELPELESLYLSIPTMLTHTSIVEPRRLERHGEGLDVGYVGAADVAAAMVPMMQ